MCPSMTNVHALWLHPGYAITPMTLKNGQVHVNEGEGQGYYQTYENSGKQCVVIIFSGRQTTDFEYQVPHNMRHLNRDVYRNHNNRQIFIVLNSNNPVKVINSDVSTTSGPADFHCVASFLYCHPSKREQSLRLGYHDKRCKVSFNGNAPTGNWFRSPLQDPNEKIPTGIDRLQPILSVTFHCNGDETKEITTLYGVVQGTNHVYRAIGTTFEDGCHRIYCDGEIDSLSRWHIVLIPAGTWW